MSRAWRLYLDDIIDACKNIGDFTKNMPIEEFVRDPKTYWSTVKMIEIIGEAARHIPDEIQALTPEVEWKRIIGARNVLTHGYFGINNAVLWDIITISVPRLEQHITKYVAENTEGEW